MSNDSGYRGDLFIQFDVIFPLYINGEKGLFTEVAVSVIKTMVEIKEN